MSKYVEYAKVRELEAVYSDYEPIRWMLGGYPLPNLLRRLGAGYLGKKYVIITVDRETGDATLSTVGVPSHQAQRVRQLFELLLRNPPKTLTDDRWELTLYIIRASTPFHEPGKIVVLEDREVVYYVLVLDSIGNR